MDGRHLSTACVAAWILACAPGARAAPDVPVAGDDGPEYRALLYRAAPNETLSPKEPLRLGPGPHLFIDDHLIDKTTDVRRRVNRPERDPGLPNPIVTGKDHLCFQPYMTVLRDAGTGGETGAGTDGGTTGGTGAGTGEYRIWYNARTQERSHVRSHVATMRSPDGIRWEAPPLVLEDPAPIQFGCCVLDDGPAARDRASRYKLAWYSHEGDGLRIAVSPDGLDWKPMTPGVVLRHDHDINNIFRDPLRGRYVATVNVFREGPTWKGRRRVTMHSASEDLVRWQEPWYVVTPDDRSDPPETQFYAMNGYLVRGTLLIAMVKVLHDDLRAEETPEGSFGVGHTQLAWSRDGETWVRDQTPFFGPDSTPGAWDHAHAWMDWQLLVDDQVYVYYAGYRNGHKVNRFEERQIGLVRMARDRYVSRDATADGGALITQPVLLDGSRLEINARVGGEIRVRLLHAGGAPIPGFDASDCRPIAGDGVALPVGWSRSLAEMRGKPVRIEFRMRDAQLYGFDLLE